jgi:pyruvate-formate lyase-activating enzyme
MLKKVDVLVSEAKQSRRLRGELDVIYLESAGIVVRVPLSMRGLRWSLIHLGRCNWRCGYCKPGGFLPRPFEVFPNTYRMPTEEVIEFAVREARQGNPVKITGGEPTLDFDEVAAIIAQAKAIGGYVCVDSNGWHPERLVELVRSCDQVAVDIKAARHKVSKITGVPASISFDRPVRAAKLIAEALPQLVLEIRTPVFSDTTATELSQIAETIPRTAFWVLRSFTPGPVDGKPIELSCKPYAPWAIPPTRGQVEAIHENLVSQFPELAGRLISLPASAREPVMITETAS